MAASSAKSYSDMSVGELMEAKTQAELMLSVLKVRCDTLQTGWDRFKSELSPKFSELDTAVQGLNIRTESMFPLTAREKCSAGLQSVRDCAQELSGYQEKIWTILISEVDELKDKAQASFDEIESELDKRAALVRKPKVGKQDEKEFPVLTEEQKEIAKISKEM